LKALLWQCAGAFSTRLRCAAFSRLSCAKALTQKKFEPYYIDAFAGTETALKQRVGNAY
jgi:hypothetical protein